MTTPDTARTPSHIAHIVYAQCTDSEEPTSTAAEEADGSDAGLPSGLVAALASLSEEERALSVAAMHSLDDDVRTTEQAAALVKAW
jgi:hypothetical protein